MPSRRQKRMAAFEGVVYEKESYEPYLEDCDVGELYYCNTSYPQLFDEPGHYYGEKRRNLHFPRWLLYSPSRSILVVLSRNLGTYLSVMKMVGFRHHRPLTIKSCCLRYAITTLVESGS